jgi:uncharacterized repeat protein (TIGR03803 family)
LAQGTNGAFYGTTITGGSASYGTIFQISSTGLLTPVYSFTNGADGGNPYGALILASDGNFYGTTCFGPGSAGQGVVFQLSPAGSLTPLHALASATDGANPFGALAQWTNGSLYGTASQGGSSGYGTLFTITPAGAFSAIYSFTNGADGAYPSAGLALGTDGNFYGTTYSGGPNGQGGIFKITPQGVLTALYLFTGGKDGAASYATLVQGNDGSFYGTTQYGGADNEGVVFKMNAYVTAPVMTSITRSAGSIAFSWLGLPGRSFQAQFATNLLQTNWTSLGGPVIATNGVGSQIDASPTPKSRFYRVYQMP